MEGPAHRFLGAGEPTPEPRGTLMTLQIDSTKGLIFVAGCVVMYFVFKYTRRSHPGPASLDLS